MRLQTSWTRRIFWCLFYSTIPYVSIVFDAIRVEFINLHGGSERPRREILFDREKYDILHYVQCIARNTQVRYWRIFVVCDVWIRVAWTCRFCTNLIYLRFAKKRIQSTRVTRFYVVKNRTESNRLNTRNNRAPSWRLLYFALTEMKRHCTEKTILKRLADENAKRNGNLKYSKIYYDSRRMIYVLKKIDETGNFDQSECFRSFANLILNIFHYINHKFNRKQWAMILM